MVHHRPCGQGFTARRLYGNTAHTTRHHDTKNTKELLDHHKAMVLLG
jgi:hypothetical protein